MYRILVEPEYNLIRQQIELMKTEEITVSFTDDSLKELARLATEINRSIENIGARFVQIAKLLSIRDINSFFFTLDDCIQ